MSRLHEATATELADRIQSGEVSSREVVEAHLARIDQVNGTTNAIPAVLADAALADADAADAAPAAGRGPLHGVPFTVKQSIDCLGSATTFGIAARRNALPHRDAPVVERMKAAGAIPIGRTNLSEMGMRIAADNPLHGRTLNPFDPSLTAGGSSGGDAVALATGMTPLGLGSDMGGSLRMPACFCGVAALKPTTGRVPHASSLEPQDFGIATQAMFVQGPMARSVDDLTLALSILAGRDRRDPRSVDAPLRGPDPEARCVALVRTIPGIDLPAATSAAIVRAGQILADVGWEVEEATPPELPRTAEIWGRLLVSDLAFLAPRMQPILTPRLSDYLARMCSRYADDAMSPYRLHTERSRLIRAWSGFFSGYPVVIGPIATRPPWSLDADLDPGTGLDDLARATAFVTPGSVLGIPSVALPTGSDAGIPTGIQICADLWREDLCLDVAAVLEAAIGAPSPIDPVR